MSLNVTIILDRGGGGKNNLLGLEMIHIIIQKIQTTKIIISQNRDSYEIQISPYMLEPYNIL